MGVYTTKYVGTWFLVIEIASLAVTVIIVLLSLWFLGGTRSFAAVQGNQPKGTEPSRWYHLKSKPEDEDSIASETDSDSDSPENIPI
ncbi:hypothetical protein SAMD00023353_2400740 [Rosellinia necatrix]|uniref:Uncharacterized protein n=1 Tax=Rosellinia necatrix TaxID=77044 RepID=A0A1W2TFS5_ROSNE|nr:hypothetical protein SAMD00023353_2400740 [Rosellinia necatrix]